MTSGVRNTPLRNATPALLWDSSGQSNTTSLPCIHAELMSSLRDEENQDVPREPGAEEPGQ